MKDLKIGQRVFVPCEGDIPYELGERMMWGDKYYCEFQGMQYNDATRQNYLVLVVIGIVDFEGVLV